MMIYLQSLISTFYMIGKIATFHIIAKAIQDPMKEKKNKR